KVPRVEEVGGGERIGDEDHHGDAEQQHLPPCEKSLHRRAEPVGDLAAVCRLAGRNGAHASVSLAARSRRMIRPFFFSARALNTTARTMTTPEIAICAKGDMPMTGSAFLMTPRKSAPSTVPITVPMPPAMETPPITVAATLSSSKPAAMST